jgi:hypothetical protein
MDETYHINCWKSKSDTLSTIDGVGRKGPYGQFFFAFAFSIMWDNMVIMISSFDSVQCLELSTYSSFLVRVTNFCVPV